jgi:hypothetical protein
MTIIHLKRVLAGNVAEMMEKQTATPEQMVSVRKNLHNYGQENQACAIVLFSN